MIRLDFNASAIFDRLHKAEAKLADLTPIHKDIGEYMTEATRKRFLSSTGVDGKPWVKKSDATKAAYRRMGHGEKTKPLIGPSGRLGKEIAKLVTRDYVEIGSALEYSSVMQNGAKAGAFGKTRTGGLIPWGDIPARVWLGISADDEQNILDIVDEHIAKAIGG